MKYLPKMEQQIKFQQTDDVSKTILTSETSNRTPPQTQVTMFTSATFGDYIQTYKRCTFTLLIKNWTATWVPTYHV